MIYHPWIAGLNSIWQLIIFKFERILYYFNWLSVSFLSNVFWVISIVGIRYKWVDCTSDPKHKIKPFRIIGFFNFETKEKHSSFKALGGHNALLWCELACQTSCQCFKTGYSLNLGMFVMSQSARPWQVFLAYTNVCG